MKNTTQFLYSIVEKLVDFLKGPSAEQKKREQEVLELSLKGRAGYCLACIENMGVKFGCFHVEAFQFLMNELWKFTNARYHDEWFERAIHLFPPENVLEFGAYHDYLEDCKNDLSTLESDILNKQSFYSLRDLYVNMNQVIIPALDIFYMVSTADLYGSIRLNGGSRKAVELMLKLMWKNKIPMPNINRFYHHKHCNVGKTGKVFTRADISPW